MLTSAVHHSEGCFEDEHVLVAIISIFCSVVLIATAAFYKYLIYEQSLANTNGKLSNFTDVTFHLLRSAMMVLFVGLPETDLGTIYYIVLYTLGTLLLYYTFNNNNARYSMESEQLFYIMTGIYVGLAAILIVSEVDQKDHASSIFFQGVFFVLLLVPLLQGHIEVRQQEWLVKEIEDCVTESEAIRYLISLIRLLSLRDDSSAQTHQIRRFVAFHICKCTQPFCQLTLAANHLQKDRPFDKAFDNLKYYITNRLSLRYTGSRPQSSCGNWKSFILWIT
jgi:hypothetical protein